MIFGPLVYPYPSNAIHAIIGRLRRPIWYVFRFPHASPDGANLALTGDLLARS